MHTLRILIASFSLLLATAVAHSQGFPTKPVRFIVGYVPGGATDLSARVLAPKMAEAFGQSVVVENRPGASGMIAAEFVAKAPPDGHTLIMATQTTHAVAPSLYRKLTYDVQRDFAPVSLAAYTPLVLVVHPSLPVGSVKELIAFIKARPGQLNFGSGGIGTSPHMSGELFNAMAGLKSIAIHYKGEAPAVIDVLGGQIPYMFANLPTVQQYFKTGRLKAFAVTSPERVATAAELPTVAESGLPGYEVFTWFGVFAPAATPREVVARIQSEIAKAAASPDVKERVSGQGLVLVANTPAQFADFVKAELVKWARVVKASGAKLD
jgi:tripartite-type tricarboxylate transporter receptor subunit TctC